MRILPFPFRQIARMVGPHITMTRQDWRALADRPYMRALLLVDAVLAIAACFLESARFDTFTAHALLDPMFLTFLALAGGLICIAFDLAARVMLPAIDLTASFLFIALCIFLTATGNSDYNFEIALTSILYFFVNITIFNRTVTLYVDTALFTAVAIKLVSSGAPTPQYVPLTQTEIELKVLILSASSLMTNYLTKIAQEERILALALAREEIARMEASGRLMEENLQLQEDLGRIKRVAAFESMATSIAHEINQPIGSALSFASAAQRWLARDPPDLSEARHSIGGATEQIEQAGQIVATIRRAASRGPKTEPVEVSLQDLFEIAKHFASIYLPDFQRRNVTCRVEPIEPCPCRALVRKHEIGQVLANLISNALDAIDQRQTDKQVSLRLSCEAGWINITVADNGSGISPAMVESIFERFYTTKSHGTGLGLSICRDIAERLGGSLTAQSNSGDGTVMRLRIPVQLGLD